MYFEKYFGALHCENIIVTLHERTGIASHLSDNVTVQSNDMEMAVVVAQKINRMLRFLDKPVWRIGRA